MKNFSPKTTLAAAATLLLTVACTNELTDGPDGGKGRIAFHPLPETRTVVENADGMAGGFNVWGWYVKDGETARHNVFNQATVMKNGDSWACSDTRYWIPNTTYNFYGVFPADMGTCTENGTLTVADFDATLGHDLMTATSAPMDGDQLASVVMPFRHELSKVAVRVATDPGITATVYSAKLYGMDTQGTLIRSTSGVSWTDIDDDDKSTVDTPSFTFDDEIEINASTPQDLFKDLLLIPQNVQGLKLELSFTRGSDRQTVQVPLDTSITRWTAGEAYRYVLTIEADAITFKGITVDGWDEAHTGGDVNIEDR
ncbi:fimbrillin family protein [Bacteroides fluxus]|uniref:fimbrillin family protein n=1 Tax=Bacteroides fluxus TaxID=626930 RepID=UPI002357B943|nr:fimbrillin family protein [Bacteroides fluxus]